jgi:histidine triad (HIT) family protein
MDAEQAVQQQKQECIFCHIIAGRTAAKKVYEDDKFVAILDINPANPGHMLVIPKEHYAVMPQIPDEELSQLSFVTKALSNACIKSLGARGTTIFAANGIAAGQRASHFMMHIIPRMPNDGVKMILPEHQIPSQQMDQIKVKISKVLAEIFGTKVPQKFSGISEKEKELEETRQEENLEKPEPPKSAANKSRPAEPRNSKTPALDEIAEFLAKNKLEMK